VYTTLDDRELLPRERFAFTFPARSNPPRDALCIIPCILVVPPVSNTPLSRLISLADRFIIPASVHGKTHGSENTLPFLRTLLVGSANDRRKRFLYFSPRTTECFYRDGYFWLRMKNRRHHVLENATDLDCLFKRIITRTYGTTFVGYKTFNRSTVRTEICRIR